MTFSPYLGLIKRTRKAIIAEVFWDKRMRRHYSWTVWRVQRYCCSFAVIDHGWKMPCVKIRIHRFTLTATFSCYLGFRFDRYPMNWTDTSLIRLQSMKLRVYLSSVTNPEGKGKFDLAENGGAASPCAFLARNVSVIFTSTYFQHLCW